MNSKKKGNAWENKIAKQIRTHFVPDEFDAKTGHNLVHRTPLSGGHVEKGDLIVKPPIWKYFPWFIECRNRESWSFKNIFEKGWDSVIGKWFIEDAVEKCHPYDNNAKYPRLPLLLFTRNQHQTYYCTWQTCINVRSHNLSPMNWGVQMRLPEDGRYDMEYGAVIGLWDPLLAAHVVDDAKVEADINEYLGVVFYE